MSAPSTCAICHLSAPSTCAICHLSAPSTCAICHLSAPSTCAICHLSVPSTCAICHLSAPSTCAVCQHPAHVLYVTYQHPAHVLYVSTQHMCYMSPISTQHMCCMSSTTYLPSVDLPRYEKVALISDKPNNVDPRALTDFTRRYNQPYKDPFHKKSATSRQYITRRPDSKDISSRYPTLAPIEENRMKNLQMSTVFEPEAWTKRFEQKDGLPGPPHQAVSRNGQVRRSYPGYSSNGFYHAPNYMTPSTASTMSSVSDEEFRARLLAMIPRGVYLPDTPIVLTPTDEARLLNILSHELYEADADQLKDIYINISNTVDKHLTGYCQYQDLFSILSRMSFKFPPDLLQLVAAMFVSDYRNQRDVNYERFLTFVAAALRNRDKIKPPSPSSSTQHHNGNTAQLGLHTPIRHTPGSPFFGDGGEIKLLRMIEAQLNENEFSIDYDKLIASFQASDRKRTGLLSANLIKDICIQHRIPIQESLIVRLLNRCEYSTKKEQYSWITLIQFLERIQPRRTRNRIKQPSEYNKSSSSSKTSRSSFSQTTTPLWKRDPPLLPLKEEVPDPNREIISRMDLELKSLERNYDSSRLPLSIKKEEVPWFKSFMQFADALYKRDEKFEGQLPYKEVSAWARMYNETYQLGIPDDVINMAMNQATKKEKVDIHLFLSILAKPH
ncbi:uncharacterized protein LOC131936477 [Physella acuta]|uniref:uncharacterized protein LOC131936477 n=1 Tax=Physella acuta TaxID=109671 RepID=UPI0027DD0CB6|nr:uncharacterized protein LOC131936477 [Physella acuta]